MRHDAVSWARDAPRRRPTPTQGGRRCSRPRRVRSHRTGQRVGTHERRPEGGPRGDAAAPDALCRFDDGAARRLEDALEPAPELPPGHRAHAHGGQRRAAQGRAAERDGRRARRGATQQGRSDRDSAHAPPPGPVAVRKSTSMSGAFSDDAAALAPSSGEKPASPRRRREADATIQHE